MDAKQAKRTGSRKTTIAVLIALATAYTLMAAITGDGGWLFSEPSLMFNIIAGAVFVLVAGAFIGRFTGVSILINGRNCYWIGIKNSFYVLWLGTLLGALIGFLQEGIHSPFGLLDGMDNYIVKPIAMVTIFGCVPTIIIGAFLGRSIKRSNADKTGQ